MALAAAPAPPLRSRDRGIDAGRYIAVAAVVLLHAIPTRMEGGPAVAQFPYLAIPARFAVPFFFITAGYFQRVDGVAPHIIVWRALRRLLPIYAIWIGIYWLVSQVAPVPDLDWRLSWSRLIQGGPLFHFWFLPALGFGLALVGVGRIKLGLGATTAIAIVLALAGLMLTSYHAPLFGGEVMEPRRNACFAPAFIVLGAWFARADVTPAPRRATAIALVGLAITIAEEILLRHVMGWPSVRSHDVTIGTFPFGAGAFLLARSWGRAAIPDPLVRLGSLSLGVYVVHLYFVRALTPLIGQATPGRVAALAIASLGLATAVSLLVSRTPGMRRLVT